MSDNPDFHTRHQVPNNQSDSDKPKAPRKGSQAERNAHYYEDGVKADGTGGKSPDASDGDGGDD